jgi:ectoine hydroxylase-related dioxygenase (phytanoyl-CoA dioxygenase family)
MNHMRSQFSRDGYYLAKNLLDVDDIGAVRRDMEQVFRLYLHTPKSEPVTHETIIDLFRNDTAGFKACAQQCQCLASVFRLAYSKGLTKFLNEVAGIELPTMNTKPLVSFSSKGTAQKTPYWYVGAHQDWPSTQGSLNGVTVWTPLVEVTGSLGPLELIPESHLQGFREHKENEGVPLLVDKSEGWISVPMNPGDVLVFSYFTVHRSGLNGSDKIRWSMHFRYDDASDPTFIDRKYPKTHIWQRLDRVIEPGFPSAEQVQNRFKL